jgi:hypothetical protein
VCASNSLLKLSGPLKKLSAREFYRRTAGEAPTMPHATREASFIMERDIDRLPCVRLNFAASSYPKYYDFARGWDRRRAVSEYHAILTRHATAVSRNEFTLEHFPSGFLGLVISNKCYDNSYVCSRWSHSGALARSLSHYVDYEY